MTGGADHWNAAYAKGDGGVSWFEERPELSLDWIARAGGAEQGVIDIGGGASALSAALLRQGLCDISVLDLSQAALDIAQTRLGDEASEVCWICADMTRWMPSRTYGVWHDRAVFHFMTTPEARAAYIAAMRAALPVGAAAVMATFADDGPEKCSGLPVQRYSPSQLAETLGAGFDLEQSARQVHVTPAGREQKFQISLLRRVEEV